LARVVFRPEPDEGLAQTISAAVGTVEVTAETEPEAGYPTELEAAGAEVTFATTVRESPSVEPAGRLNVTGTEHNAPTRQVGTVPIVMEVAALEVAEAGATKLTSPNPTAETATSAMRLRVVFVDICFLSIVDFEAFSRSAWQRDKPLTS